MFVGNCHTCIATGPWHLLATVITSDIDTEHGKPRLLHGVHNTFTNIVLIASVKRFSHQLREGVNNCPRVGRTDVRCLESHLALQSIWRHPATTNYFWVGCLFFLPVHFSHVWTCFLDSRSRKFQTLAGTINGSTVSKKQFNLIQKKTSLTA